MFERLPKRQGPSLPIRREVINNAADGAARGLSVAYPLAMQRHPGGWLLRLAGNIVGIRIIKTASAISGRSGTVPGTGSAYVVAFDGTNLVDGDEFDILNVASGGGAAGKYGLVARVGGYWWMIALEC